MFNLNKFELMKEVSDSILLFGSEIWAGALRKDEYRRQLSTDQKSLRNICSQRIVSEPVAIVDFRNAFERKML